MDSGNIIFVDFKNRRRIPTEEAPKLDLIESNIANSNEEKLQVFSSYLETGIVRTVVNSLAEDVKVPNEHRVAKLPLNWSFKFKVADFGYDKYGVRGTLLFSQKPFFVDIPWERVAAIFSLANPEDSLRIWNND